MGMIDFLSRITGQGRAINLTADELWERIVGDDYGHNYGNIYFSDGTRVRGSAFTMAGAYRAITLLSSVTAATPIDVVDLEGKPVSLQRGPAEMEEGTRNHVARNWKRLLMHGKPDGRLDVYAFFEQMVIDLINRGNVFLLPGMDTRRGPTLEIMRPVLMGYGSAEATGFVRSLPLDQEWSCRTLTGEIRQVMPGSLIHISLPILGVEHSTLKLPLGLPLAWVAKDSIAGGKAADAFIVETINSSNRRGLKMELEANLDNKETINRYYQMADRVKGNTRVFLIDGGVKIGELKSPHEMMKAVGEARIQQIEEVARPFGVPAPLIGLSSSAWAAGVEQLARVFLRFAVRPFWWRRIESALTASLLPFGFKFQYDDTDFLRGDWQAWSALAGAATQSGSLSLEELRHAGGFPRRFPEGDTRLTTPYVGKEGGGQQNDPNTGQPKK